MNTQVFSAYTIADTNTVLFDHYISWNQKFQLFNFPDK